MASTSRPVTTTLLPTCPLKERLFNDFGLELPIIDDNEDWRPGDYLEKVAHRISSQPRWEVDRDGIQLGFFSFAKLLMLRDLDCYQLA